MFALGGERQFGRHFKRQFGRGQVSVKHRCEIIGSQFLPRGIKMSRRALWDVVFLECMRSHFGARKGQMVNFGSRAQNSRECL